MDNSDVDAAIAENLATLRENWARITDYETLLGASICLVADVVVAKARAAGVERPNVPAVLEAATVKILEIWQRDKPEFFAAYLAEIGPEPADV